MAGRWRLPLLLVGTTLRAAAAAAAPQTDAPPDAAAVRGLLGRLLPAHVAAQFELEHRPLTQPERDGGLTDYFELLPPAAAKAVRVRGSSGVAMASGVRHYLWHDAVRKLARELLFDR